MAEIGYTCDNCHKRLKDPMRCGKCKSAPYCDRECQKKHWKEHKKVCCTDITILNDKDTNKLGLEFIELIKYDKDFVYQIVFRYSDNKGKRLTVVSVMYDRSTNKFEQLKLADMSVLVYQKMSQTKDICDLNSGSFYFIIVNERSQVMITGVISLSNIIDF